MKPILTLSLIGLVAAAATGLVIADDDDRNEYLGGWLKRHDVAPVTSDLYRQECGGCHFAYQPGLLPADSWQAITDGLADHFGENAELLPGDRAAIVRYLQDNAADRSDVGRSKGMARGTQTLRITEGAYFLRKHDEIPLRMVKDNPQVGSFSNCDACHTTAKDGNFDEHRVRIPGVGRWED